MPRYSRHARARQLYPQSSFLGDVWLFQHLFVRIQASIHSGIDATQLYAVLITNTAPSMMNQGIFRALCNLIPSTTPQFNVWIALIQLVFEQRPEVLNWIKIRVT